MGRKLKRAGTKVVLGKSSLVEEGAFVLVAPDGRIEYAGEAATVWLKQFFANGQPKGYLPRRVGDWLADGVNGRPIAALIAQREDARLFVRLLHPRLADSIPLLLEHQNGDGHGKRPVRYKDVTAREMEVWRCLWQHRSDKEIAAELHISLSTTANHVASILKKLDVHGRSAAASLYPG